MFGCSGSKIISVATKGELSKKTFNEKMKFDYLEKHIFINVEISKKKLYFSF